MPRADMSTSNGYCAALGIRVPRLEDARSSSDANCYSLFLVALLEQGEPMTLAEAAVRFEEAGVAPAQEALASLKRCKPARAPIYRDGDHYALDPHDAEVGFWLFRLGLRPPPVAPLQVVPPAHGPLSSPDRPLTIASLDEAWRDGVPSSWSAQRVAIAVLDSHDAAMFPADVVAFVGARSPWSPLRAESAQFWRSGAVQLRGDGRWELDRAHDVVRSAREAVRERIASVRRWAEMRPEGPHVGAFPADGAAAVIDASENLSLDALRAAYSRIAQAKRLKKKPAPSLKGAATTTVTLGIILAQRSDLPIEALAEELDRLNTATPGRERPDMLVLASTGTINYAVQFPGESVTGDFLPPAEGALDAFTPPMYIVMVMNPTGDYALNKMVAFLIAHLEIFSPGANVPKWIEVLQGVTSHVVTFTGYQYNQRGDLVPVPRQFYNDRYLAPRPVVLEDQKGSPLATLQFLPWQDGAAILLYGKLPLDGLLVFLGKDALKRGGIIKLKDGQISYVLPITAADFGDMLARIQRQSNMRVRPEEANWVVQKIADEGSQSPFMARLMMGILRLRDAAFPDPPARDPFDNAYQFTMTSLFAARDATRELAGLWTAHARKVASGDAASLQGRTIRVNESIDREPGQQADAFLNAATRALKKGMQDVAAVLRADIGFLFQKQAAFEAGIAALEKSDPALADYLRQARTWSERLLDARNAVEHKGWTLPRIVYARTDTGVTAIEPVISGEPASAFAAFVFDRLACFVEEVTAHCMQRQFPTGITVTELPRESRPAEMPERFRLTVADRGMRPCGRAQCTSDRPRDSSESPVGPWASIPGPCRSGA